MSALLADIRYALRVLLRTPSFTLAAVAVLALGLARTPPSSASSMPCCCVRCRTSSRSGSSGSSTCHRRAPFPGCDSSASRRPISSTGSGMRRRSRGWRSTRSASSRSPAESARIGRGRGGGRGFLRSRARASRRSGGCSARTRSPPKAHVAILSYGFWQSHFGGTADAVGKTLTLNGDVYTIVGVMPRSLLGFLLGRRGARVVGPARLHGKGARRPRQSQRQRRSRG